MSNCQKEYHFHRCVLRTVGTKCWNGCARGCAMSTDIQSHGRQHVAAIVGLYFCLITWTAKVWNLIYLTNFDLGFGLKMGFKNPLHSMQNLSRRVFFFRGKKKLQAFSVQSSFLHQRESSIAVLFYKDSDVTKGRVKQTLWHIMVKVENWYKAFFRAGNDHQNVTTQAHTGVHWTLPTHTLSLVQTQVYLTRASCSSLREKMVSRMIYVYSWKDLWSR